MSAKIYYKRTSDGTLVELLLPNVGGFVNANAPITGGTATKLTFDSKGLVTGGSNATTADISDTTDKRYQTDNQKLYNDATSSIQTQFNQKVSTGTTINGHNLSTNISITSSEVGAYTSGQTDTLLNNKVDKVLNKSLVFDTEIVKIHTQNSDNALLSPDKLLTALYTDNAGNVHIQGNIIQSGTTYETHIENVFTTKDKMTLRDGSVAALSNGVYAGLTIKKYDGTNDGSIEMGNDGLFRIGNSTGVHRVPTIEDTPTNDYLTKYDSASGNLVSIIRNTSSIPASTDNNYVTDFEKTNISYLSGVTSNIQSQLNSKSNTGHTHTGVYEEISNKSTDITMGGVTPSDTLYPSQKAAKSYMDGVLSAANALVYKGEFDGSEFNMGLSFPKYPAANAGDVYRVTVAGTIGGNLTPGTTLVEVGDVLICTVDNSPEETEAVVGANWVILNKNLDGVVIGPSSSSNSTIALFDGTTGKLLKDSIKTIVTSLGVNDTTIPTSLAVKTVTDTKVSYTGATSNVDLGTHNITTNDLLFSDVNFNTISTTDFISDVSSSGVDSGMVLSIGTPNTSFSISSGKYFLVVNNGTSSAKEIIYSGVTNVNLTTYNGVATYIGVNESGIIQQDTPFTNIQLRTIVSIGACIHAKTSNVIIVVNQLQNSIVSPASLVHDLEKGLGYFNVSGNIFSASSNNLTIDKTIGVAHKMGTNWDISSLDPSEKTYDALVAPTFQYRDLLGGNASSTTNIDPTKWDNGSGTLQTVSSNKFSVQRINIFPSNLVRIQYGQKEYNSMAEAISGIQVDSFVVEQNILENGLLRGFLIVRGNTTDLSATIDAKFLEASKFGSTGGVGGLSTTTLQQAYDNSSEPEILTNLTHGSLSIKNGQSLDSSLQFEIKNISGTTTFSVDGNGNQTVYDSFNTSLNRSSVTVGIDTKLNTGIPWGERSKFKLTVSYSAPNVVAQMSFNGGNTSFSYYINDKKFIVTSGNTMLNAITATAAEGTWFLKIDQNNTLILSQIPWNIYDPDVLLWNFQFNATNNTIVDIGEERHTAGRDIFQHARNHAQGAIYKSGFLASNYNGLSATLINTNTDNNFGRALVQVGNGSFYDEDILNNILHTDASIASTTTNPYTDWDRNVQQFLGFTEVATTGTNNTTIVFSNSHTLITGQAVTIMNGNTQTVRGTATINAGGTSTSFSITVATGTGFVSGDAIVIGARIPIYYVSSVSGSNYTWRKLTTSDFLGVSGGNVITNANITTAVAQYNNTSTGGFTNITSTRFYPVFLAATNSTSEPVIAIMGQAQSSNSTLATSLLETPFQFSGLVGTSGLGIQEICPFYRLTFQYSSQASFNQSRIRLVDATFINIRVSTVSGSIVGGGNTSVAAINVITDTTNFVGNSSLTVLDTNVQSSLETLNTGKKNSIKSVTVTSNTNMSGLTYNYYISNGTNLTHTLPNPVTYPNMEWVITNINSSNVNLIGTLHGDINPKLYPTETFNFFSDGTNLYIK